MPWQLQFSRKLPEEDDAMALTYLKDVIPILDVRDVNAALRFYIERLGFQLDFRYEEDPDNYAGVRRGDVCLHMQWQHADNFDNGVAGNLRVRIVVDDPDALFDEYSSAGVLDEGAG
jgi:catechol 2,3-dioxygenase-like lactoylglutathione lyase family enzyme